MVAEIETAAPEVIAVEELVAGDAIADLKAKNAAAANAVVPDDEAAPLEKVGNGDVKLGNGAAVIDVVAENGDVVAENGDAVAENGDVVAENGDAAAVAEETNTDAAAEEVVSEPPAPAKVILHMRPPMKSLPTTCMFCLKLETYLKMHEIPYEAAYGNKVGKNGKVPWIEYKGEKVCDSTAIIHFLNEKFEIENIDDKLGEQDRFVARAVQVMLEENTQWGVQYSRWVDSFQEYKAVMAAQTGQTGLMFQAQQKLQQKKVRSGLDMHGLGKHTKDEVYAIVGKDLKALSGLLGEKTFLFGEEVSTLDIIAFSLVAQITQAGVDSPMTQLIDAECSNLMDHYTTMKEAYWADWVDKADRVPPVKKTFSFRKKKTTATPTKEEGAASPAPEENGVASEDATPAEGEAAEATTEETPAAEEIAAETPATETTADDTAAAAEDASKPADEAAPETAVEVSEAAIAETTAEEPAAVESTPAESTPTTESTAIADPVVNGEPIGNGEASAEEKPAE